VFTRRSPVHDRHESKPVRQVSRAAVYLDDKMHDLHVERLLNERPDGPIKTFTLRAIRSARRASTMVGF
jgi:hypothetical protein